MKYSIVIATHNGIQHTVQCVNSILEFTEDFEIIIVDNGSTDGTVGYLQELGKNHTAVKVIYNRENRTFAQSNNQGISVAQGEYLCLLNNDTIVNRDWIERLREHFEHAPMKNIGIVGPVSCNSNGRQAVGVQDPAAWYAQNRGRWSHAGILYGWCMLMKRSLIDEIGSFDERFTNSHEDNDLCLRAQHAGYKLLIAYDTYIHHTGQGTLRSMFSIEQYAINGDINRKRFFEKWYSDKPQRLVAVYRTNGGEWLERSLWQTSKFADSIIIHFCRAKDKVSEERLARIREKFPKICHVEFYDGVFQEDYERGRLLELALEMHAKGEADWCISVDDDELYEDKFIKRCQKMMHPHNPEIFAYWCNWRTIWDKRGDTEYYRGDSTFGSFMNYRFFKLMKGQEIMSNHPEGHHCGSSPWFAPENLRWSNIRVKHMGYDTHEQRQKKFEFYQENDHFKTKQDIGYDDYSHLIEVNVQLEKYDDNNGISLIMMVKNEEKLIRQCLELIEPLVDEIVIVDTGSTDSTVNILKEYAKYAPVDVKILNYQWEDNYSTPRNYGKFNATQKWILMMDADERFEFQDLAKIYQMTETNADLVIFHVVNYMKRTRINEKPVYASSESVRLYRNIPEFYYTGIIHETIDDAVVALQGRKKLMIGRSPILLYHFGYLKEEKKVKAKLEYYEKLNKDQIEITLEKDPRPYFNLALHYMNDKALYPLAITMLRKALELNPLFWHANQQMAALNLENARTFMERTLESMPQEHPFRKQVVEMLEYINTHSSGYIGIGDKCQ